ncbi:Glucoamylase (glucan-1,4-alpha-glucosidase), GH15 family [Pseudomonas sp. URIL14HWK12:I9]|nr:MULTISPECIES: glycoside hydrolase family 15 protein [unclassified Pseudomonas]PVZ13694.1 GH15 family glucan-1,4-alpha-glucosidase [Pseudomonas sp. URIL14HWK12:I12]PVZ24000.1 GH15 family glucan-1,4-alpha-glucosidase [Pseudomonas sp. URIL14HWK12:I10]PVZ33361.1 GH15 family glucan-1,4-alpha-glucosidase [Pseudomonas sp. URIL14HWK12:I11]SNZ11291.1 Glucoamylase (glucan-1,4-alpha-glucosidase), GH15 family [Pseudomonas sp. URIL14HWK12:I9]
MDETWRPQPIADHGIIGNMRSAALVACDGSIDFCCWPDFDSPTLFCALLDTPKAGLFRLAPVLPDARRMQIYLPGSNVLRTRWISGDTMVEVTDLMPITVSAEAPPRIVRRVQVAHGRARIELHCRVAHDYARAQTHAQAQGSAVHFSAPGQPSLRLVGSQPLHVQDQAAHAYFDLEQGECAEFILGAEDDPLVEAGHAERCLNDTLSFWRDWLSKSRYRGRWREAVERSALVLKLLTSRQHGAILAAPTFGLPETPGGERNWDYRYTWIRDASFTVYAFMRLGFSEEANAYVHWVRERVSDCCGEQRPLRLMYGQDGREELPESTLEHLRGHGGATPVRVGNQAYEQKQLDIYGELMDAVYLANKYGEAMTHQGWRNCQTLVEHVCAHWEEADVGIWEKRDAPQHFLHSRLMCWVAVDRAIRLAQKRSLPAPFAKWEHARQAIHNDIWDNFWNQDLGHFVQTRGGTGLDGAMLLMPLVRFVGATDPQWLSTLRAIERELVRDGMVYRYREDDGLPGQEGAFTACSFWYVECLARAGEVDRAHLEFEQLLRYAGPTGLYAEEFDSHAHPLGNAPQALSHLALISAATYLNRLLDGEAIQWQP